MIPPAHFQDLQNLVSVDLGFNDFNGSIPSSLFSLQKVQQIQLSNNNFDGLLVDFTNPSLSSLDTLDLSSNKLEGEIPRTFFELGKLSVLLLSSNNLSGTIKTVEFQNRLSNLTNLDLSFNNLSIITSDDISLVSNLPKFSTLKLASCKLRKFLNLRNQKRLKYLDLSNNEIEGKIPTWIWEVGSGSLSYMNLSHNRLTSLEEPYNFPNLTVLDMHSNHLSGVIPIPPRTATIINYSNNRFNSSLPESIGRNLSYAYFFSVSDSLLTGVIPKTICNATYLKVLDLSNNWLKGSIPNCLIESGSSLGVLSLGNNSLSGKIEGTFPRNCGLNTLDLHGNGIEGTIPGSLVNCTMLEVLNLGKNNINDTYPCSLGNNTNLRVLVLRSNRLHGSVGCSQNQHNNWPKLQIIDIACNKLSGVIPKDCFLQWGAMMADESRDPSKHLRFKVLQFGGIYYQDTVTVTAKGLELELVKILTLFTSVDISSNQFSGEIPSTIGRLKALRVLNCSSSNIPETEFAPEVEESKNRYDWQFIIIGVSFGTGAAIVIGTLMLSKKVRHFWDKYTTELVKLICLALGIRYAPYGLFEEDEDEEKETLDSDENSDESELESEVDRSKGRYCVFCTKLDFSRKQAIHDTKCTCFDRTKLLPTLSSICSSEAVSPYIKL
ncbi:hypothetical protein L1987_63559 [Smallanthus sonchifolius]|uniref:Uncharacterized protein n=1 Tax=Smallanthus sonchifolius TaxID=185202 RepID=A0ACB9CDM3_9ASTR|nr:hypothetical protein L1987_63559 [Smallanthus sonchifolius]